MCGIIENQAAIHRNEASICIILAHPDDETIITGILAMLTGQVHENIDSVTD